MVDLPLAGTRVLDLGDPVAEAATRLLADLGADVVKLEPPGGSASRSAAPVVDGVSLTHALANAGKRIATGDPESIRRLAAEADVVVVDRDGAELAAELHALHPRLVAVVSSPFGSSGPRAGWQATERTLLALSGSVSRSGRPGDVPLVPPDGIATATASTALAWTTLVALRTARASGRGQVVDLSHHEAVTTGLDPAFGVQGSAAAGRSGKVRRGRPSADSYPIYACADGYVRLCLLARRQWRGMFAWLGEPAELADPRFDRIIERVRAADVLEPMITALFADQPGHVLVEEAARRGVPLAQVLTLGEALRADHFTTAGSVAEVEVAPGLRAVAPVGALDVDGERLGHRGPATPVDGTPSWRPREAPRPRTADAGAPFAGLRVLDLGVIVFGAEIGRAFADLGADVVKVESLAFPDGLRQTRDGAAMNASFAWGQRGKRSLGLDLRSDEGRRLFLRLAAGSDVVLSNFKPGTLDALGIGHDVLAALAPGIVVVESAAFSSRGPWARRLGYGPLVRAACGISSLWRYHPDDTECWDGVTVYPDHVAARVGAIGVAAALARRERTGVGARIELGQSDVVLHQLAAWAAAESLRPGAAVAVGNHGHLPYSELVACRGDDEWCVVEARDDTEVGRLRDVVGHDLPLPGAVVAWAAERTPSEAMETLQAAGLPAAAMVRLDELRDDPQLAHRGSFGTLVHPALDGPLPTERAAAPYGLLDVGDPAPAPAVGEHTRQVCRDLLGLGDDEVDALLERGVLHEGAALAPSPA